MILTRHWIDGMSRLALDGRLLRAGLMMDVLLALTREEFMELLEESRADEPPAGELVAPIEFGQEVWACGVTYRRSLIEREAESSAADVYAKVYEADRPEIFFKSSCHRVRGHGESIRIRRDSAWNVPEPELTLVVNAHGDIVGYTAGNDVSSRSIEGENPLYLPQAKCYDGACALGPGIVLTDDPGEVPISLSILRGGKEAFAGEANTSQMKRRYAELVEYLFRETTFPSGVFLMTGTGIVPSSDFTLQAKDRVVVRVGELTLENEVA